MPNNPTFSGTYWLGIVASRLSPEFLSLCGRLEQLRKHLLPATFDPLGNYSPSQYDQTRGHIAMTHAEVEAFIESRCLTVANTCVQEWIQNRKPSAVIVALHAICYSGWNGLIDEPSFKKPTDQVSVEARIADALVQYKQAVGGNNGIKEADLKRLLIPLSIRMNDLDTAWLSAMNSFGQTRGQVAHQSSAGVLQQPDPKEQRKTIWKDIIPVVERGQPFNVDILESSECRLASWIFLLILRRTT